MRSGRAIRNALHYPILVDGDGGTSLYGKRSALNDAISRRSAQNISLQGHFVIAHSRSMCEKAQLMLNRDFAASIRIVLTRSSSCWCSIASEERA